MLQENKKEYLHFFNYEPRIKSTGFSSRIENEANLKITTKFSHFLKGNPAKHQYLTILAKA